MRNDVTFYLRRNGRTPRLAVRLLHAGYRRRAAKVDRVVFGATIDDAAAAGFRELHVAAETLAEMGRSPLVVEGGLLREECAALFSEWKKAGLCGTY
jgi:hypothetical protein